MYFDEVKSTNPKSNTYLQQGTAAERRAGQRPGRVQRTALRRRNRCDRIQKRAGALGRINCGQSGALCMPWANQGAVTGERSRRAGGKASRSMPIRAPAKKPPVYLPRSRDGSSLAASGCHSPFSMGDTHYDGWGVQHECISMSS